MPVLAALGLLLSVVGVGYSVYDIISTGSWESWGFFDWVVNIGLILLAAFPLLGGVFTTLKGILVATGAGVGFFAKFAIVTKLVDWLWAIKTALKTSWVFAAAHWFSRGGFLWSIGRAMGTILRLLKKPWVLGGVLFASTMADGIGQRIYQLWGQASLKAFDVMLSTFENFASESGIGNPVVEAANIIRGSKSALPECFTAIWGAVEADVCIGLVISTFQYCILLSAIAQGYRLYGRYGDSR